MKKFLVMIFTLITSLSIGRTSFAQENTVNIHLFWQLGCPHCEDEIEFLNNYEKNNPDVEVYRYEISRSRKNAQLISEVAEILEIKLGSIPITVIGNSYFIGFGNEQTHASVIENLVQEARNSGFPDVVKPIISDNKPSTTKAPLEDPSIPEKINVPIFKEIDIKNLSLPALTFVIALADGFNPCAMWVLLFLISLLLNMQNRRKMWLMGGVFILVSGLVYFVFLIAWLNLFLVLGYVKWIRIIIGLVALYAAYHNINEYRKNKEGCEVVAGNEKRKRTFEKLKKYVSEKNLLIALSGIALLAIAVNMVELVCSAGLPAIYTKVLTLSSLPTWKYYAYLVLYIVIFMLDDTVVFLIAMTTLKSIGLTGKYSRFSHLIGGVLMLAIGILMIFKPEVLMFG